MAFRVAKPLLAIARTSISFVFFRFRAWLFRQMIKDAPRWSSPRERCTRPSDAKLGVGRKEEDEADE
eukprot:4505698-Pyramimonas_sp.AAC.1